MLLLKGFGKDGFRFFTNYESRKGKELGRVRAGRASLHPVYEVFLPLPCFILSLLRLPPASGPLYSE